MAFESKIGIVMRMNHHITTYVTDALALDADKK